eukprot:7930017-Ditylum_brightwellii.AAC.1
MKWIRCPLPLCNREGLDMVWGLVSTGIGSKLLAEAKVDLAQRVFMGVMSPHTFKCLCNGTQVLLHREFVEMLFTCYQDSKAEAICDEL